MKTYLLPLLLIAPLGLSACSTLDEDVARFETMSCYDLAKQIGRWEQSLERAENDGDNAIWDDVFADNDDEEDAATADGIVAGIEEDEARAYLTELRRIEANRGCR